MELGGEVLKVAAKIRTNTRPGARRPLGDVKNILFTPWETVTSGETCTYLGAVEKTIQLEFIELPPTAKAEALHHHWQQTLDERQARGAQEWEIRVAAKFTKWSQNLLDAGKHGHPTLELHLQALRVNDIVIAAMNVETFFETGITIREQSPFPDTFVLGYSNGLSSYLPRAADYPEGGWDVEASYAIPDLMFQGYLLPVALHPDSEQRAVNETVELIRQLSNDKGT
jgi:hypothetical protein